MSQPSRTLSPALADEFRERLLAARAELLRTVALTDEELATLETHQPGAPSEDVAREEVLAILSRLDGREKHELDEIYAAYARLDAGRFGVCQACEDEISLARLGAMPTARYCLACQTAREARAG